MGEIVTIIPAYNEEKNIGQVLDVLTNIDILNHIIVVSDGSTDLTVEVALSYGVEVLELQENRGKGGAMKAGVDYYSRADIILFLDADLIGLQQKHIYCLLEPVISGEADMTIGIFEKGRKATDLAQKMAPFLSGQRAIKRYILENISDMDIARFGVEIALHRYVEENGAKVKEVVLPELSHIMKEEKLGLWKGMAARMKMYWEIFRYFAKVDSLK